MIQNPLVYQTKKRQIVVIRHFMQSVVGVAMGILHLSVR